MKKKLYCLAKNLGMGDESLMQLYKKLFCAGYLLSTFKNFATRLVLDKKDKKGSFIVGLKNFYHYFLEIEAEEIIFKKIK